jgi:hypothetical protein
MRDAGISTESREFAPRAPSCSGGYDAWAGFTASIRCESHPAKRKLTSVGAWRGQIYTSLGEFLFTEKYKPFGLRLSTNIATHGHGSESAATRDPIPHPAAHARPEVRQRLLPHTTVRALPRSPPCLQPNLRLFPFFGWV